MQKENTTCRDRSGGPPKSNTLINYLEVVYKRKILVWQLLLIPPVPRRNLVKMGATARFPSPDPPRLRYGISLNIRFLEFIFTFSRNIGAGGIDVKGVRMWRSICTPKYSRIVDQSQGGLRWGVRK